MFKYACICIFWNNIYRIVRKKPFRAAAVVWCLFLLCMSLANFDAGAILDRKKGIYTEQTVPDQPISTRSVHTSTTSQSSLVNGTSDIQEPYESEENSKQYDILINSYMRSGSSFTGQLLAFQPDTFYWYEPMWASHGLYYFMGKYICVQSNVCGDFGSDKIAVIYHLLDSIYNCNLRQVPDAVTEHMTPYHSGASWKPYLSCRGKNHFKLHCLNVMIEVCQRSKHRATKVVRLTVDNLEHILEHHPNVKAIHLIRDPRAIINSKITTKWNNLSDSGQNLDMRIKKDAEDLCIRMKYDLIQGEKLKQKYPGRFAFVMFEDMQTDLKTKTKVLYSYFGIDKSRLDSKLADISDIIQDDHKVKRTRGDYTNWWRVQLSFSTINIVDSVCKDVLSFLGYRIYLNESEVKDLSSKAFNFRKDMLLTNLNKNQQYDFEALHNQSPYKRQIKVIPKYGTTITEHKTIAI